MGWQSQLTGWPGVTTLEQDLSLIAQARQTDALARRARFRARLDMLLVGTATAAAAFAGGSSHQALMGGSAALSLGILFYVIRRDRDLTALAGQGRWRDDVLKGRGLSMEEWRAGAELKPWDDRRDRLDRQPD
jgi:hypothetical protein